MEVLRRLVFRNAFRSFAALATLDTNMAVGLDSAWLVPTGTWALLLSNRTSDATTRRLWYKIGTILGIILAAVPAVQLWRP